MEVTITLANRGGATFRADQRMPLLDTLEARGVSLPYGCRYGGCISCAAKLLSGEVDQRAGVALNGRQLGDGYVLLCVARPLGDCTLAVGVESHDKLYRNPFASPLAPHELKPLHSDTAGERAATAVAYMDHHQDYPAGYLATILKEVKTIAMVGASPDPTKFSYGVLRVLHETGYDMIPVNPNEAGGEIRGLRVYESLVAIDRPVDMVQVFRSSDALPAITREAIDIGAKVLWTQLGVRDDEAARLAEAAGLKVVMNRCPKIELFRPFWKPRLNQAI
ncbi:MAG: CoA-binding protein [Caldimonas sp.]